MGPGQMGDVAHQRARQRLAAETDVLEPGERRARLVVHHQHPRHRRGALQVRDAVAADLGGDGIVARRGTGGDIGIDRAHDLSERVEARQQRVDLDPIVDQAGDLGHPDLLDLGDAGERVVDRAEETAVVEIALEGEIEDLFELAFGENAEIELEGVFHPLRFLERRKGPGVLLDEPGGRAQVILHRLAGDLAGVVAGVREEGVQHQGDLEMRRIVARFAERLVVDLDLARHFIDRLAEEVREHVATVAARLAPGFGVARRGDPEVQRLGDRPRLGDNLVHLAVLAREGDRFTGPEFAQIGDLAEHRSLVLGRRVLGAQDEIVGLPAAGDGKPCPALGEVVDHRPFFGDPRRVVQGRDAGARAHADVAGEPRHRRAGHARVRVRAPEGMEVALGRPDRGEAVLVGEFRAFQQRAVLAAPAPVVVAPVVEAELHAAEPGGAGVGCGRCGALARDQRPAFVAGEHQLEAACEGPEQLQHRDVEGERSDREPDPARRMVDPVVHADEEVGHVAVLDHHPLGLSGRAGGVDHVGEVGAGDAAFRIGVGLIVEAFGDVEDLRIALGERCREGGIGDDHARFAVFEVERGALGRIGRVHRKIGPARFQDREGGDHQFGGAWQVQPDDHAGFDTETYELVGEPVGGGVEFRIGQALALEGERLGPGRARDLILEGLVDAFVGIIGDVGRIPVGDQGLALGFGEQRQRRRVVAVAEMGEEMGKPRRHEVERGGFDPRPVAVERGTLRRDREGERREADEPGLGIVRKRELRQGGLGARQTGDEVGGEGTAGARGVDGLLEGGDHGFETVGLGEPDRDPIAQMRGQRAGHGRHRQGQIGDALTPKPRHHQRESGADPVGADAFGQGDRARERAGRARGTGDQRQIDRRDRFERLAPGRVGFGERGQRGVEHGAALGRRALQDCTDAGDVGRLRGRAGEIGDPGHHEIALARGDGKLGRIRRQHRARRGAGAALRDMGGTSEPEPTAGFELGQGERVPVVAMVQRADHPDEIGGGRCEIEHRTRLRPGVAAEIGPEAKVLFLPGGFGLGKLGHQRREAVDGRAVALGVERKRRVVLGDLEACRGEHVAFVDPALDQVPGDAVALFARDGSPDRRVEPGIGGQRAIVEIDRAAFGEGQHGVGQDVEVGDGKEPVEAQAPEPLGEPPARRDHVEPGGLGPGRDIGVAGDDGGDLVTGPDEEVAALDDEAFMADEDGTEMGHVRSNPGIGSWKLGPLRAPDVPDGRAGARGRHGPGAW